MADPRMGARKERPPLRGTADGGALGLVPGVSEDAGTSHEPPKAWEGLQWS
jgi:hypothetical protein